MVRLFWFVQGIIVSFVIHQSNFFGFGFMKIDLKPLRMKAIYLYFMKTVYCALRGSLSLLSLQMKTNLRSFMG